MIIIENEKTIPFIFSANKARITCREPLSVNIVELTTPKLATAQIKVIAHIVYYDKNDQVSSGNAISVFGIMPFMNGVDVFLGVRNFIQLNYQNRTMTITALPASIIILVAVFE